MSTLLFNRLWLSARVLEFNNKIWMVTFISTARVVLCTLCSPLAQLGRTPLEFFLNVFHWIRRIQWQKMYGIKRARTCHPVTCSVRDQHATTAPARHIWEIGSLNWAQFMLQWFISFSEFTEFSESSAPFRKNYIMLVISDTPPLLWCRDVSKWVSPIKRI